MTSYYDHVLGLIPLAFAAVTATLSFTGFPTSVAIPVAGGVGVVLVAHALFVNGPVEDVVEADVVDPHVGPAEQSLTEPVETSRPADDPLHTSSAD